jgi:two-component system CheB/CheR fusion protein
MERLPKSPRNDTEPNKETHLQTEAKLLDAWAYAKSIVDTVREPMLVLDGKLRVKTASRAFYYTFGVSREATEGRFLYDLGNGQWNIPKLRTLLEEVLPLKKALQDFEIVHDFPTLGNRVMLLNARSLWREDDQTMLFLLAIEDITERKRIEEELLQSNEDLQRFAYAAAHDLRAPLNGALSLAQVLKKHLEGRLDPEDSKLLSMSIENMERLAKLMRDLLNYAEMGNAPQQYTPVPLEESLNIAIANLQHHIEQQGAIITIGTLPNVFVDRTHVALIFQNLISNAIKYRRTQAPRISIDALQGSNDCQLSISDNGQGFNPKFATRIFEPFKRLHGPSVTGSGIGLAISKRMVERMGGRIWAESTPGEGSTFYFTLPSEQKSNSV